MHKSPDTILNQIIKLLQSQDSDYNSLKRILLKLVLSAYNTNAVILSYISTRIIEAIVDLALCDLTKQTENVKLLELVFSVKDYQNLYGKILKL